MRSLFAVTVFLSAALLFVVEPMVARALLPLLGGSPAVWNTCVLFFQSALLVGYAYAHFSTKFLGVRRQAIVHSVILLACGLALPIAFAERDVTWSPDHTPVFAVLGLLVVRVGLPFTLLSASAPLVQRWLTVASPKSNPYPLYVASNAGSVLALLAYPLLAEPYLGLASQGRAWKWAYFALVGLALACAVMTARSRDDAPTSASKLTPGPSITWRRRARWVLLAFAPSSLMVGVTTYLSNEIIALPLLWVAPLALYLVTFMIAFSSRRVIDKTLASRLFALLGTLSVFTLGAEVTGPAAALLVVHLGMFFVAALVCHGALADDKPDPTHLTEFYAWMSVGGALGGLFNAIVAPAVFSAVLEYPIVIVLAASLRPPQDAGDDESKEKKGDFAWPAAVGLATFGLLYFAYLRKVTSGTPLTMAAVGLPLLAQYRGSRRPLRFALGLGASLLAASLAPELGHTLARERSFFGVLRVTTDADGLYRHLTHGNTEHGRQSTDPARAREPLAYFTRTGPIGEIFATYGERSKEVGVIGLGCGSMASYRNPAQKWTFYEIDPAVLHVAVDPKYFTYLSDAFPGGEGLSIVMGDARLRLREAAREQFDLFVVDAYNSDAIPIHLVVREAFSLYLSKLKPQGVLGVHLSNRYFDLTPVIGSLAKDAGAFGRCWVDFPIPDADRAKGKNPSIWCAVSKDAAVLAELPPHWTPAPLSDKPVWTDDWSYVLGTLR